MAGQTVVVSVLADTKKFSRAFKDLGKQTGLTSLGNKVKDFGSKLASMAKTGVKALAGIGLAIATLAIKGGISRMLNIEDAQAKLRGLGHDAKSVDAIMTDALASVKGTAFGLDEAATTAATAVAAGIKPGQELEGYLRLVADAATIAGIDMGEMGSIMNKVNANGKAMTENLNQLSDRGIPILGWLADEYGVTTEEMSKMVSQGKVDAETFNRVLEENIGGAALESGNTTRGAFKNMMAALSRAGESVLTDVFPMFKDAFGGITVWLDNLTDRLKPLGEAFSKWLAETAVPAAKNLAAAFRDNVVPVLKQFADWVMNTVVPAVRDLAAWIGDNVIPALKNLVKWIVDNRTMLMGLAVAITAGIAAYKAFMFINTVITAVKAAAAAFKALNLAMLANPIGLIIAAITALVAALVWFFTQTETGKAIWENVWGAIQAAVAAVVDWWQNTAWPAIETVWNFIMDAATKVADWYMTHVAPIFEAVGELLGAIFEKIGEVVTWLWNTIIQPYFTFIIDLWKNVWNGIKAAWEVVGPPLMAAIEGAITVMKTVWETIWNVIKAVFEAVWNTIKNVVETILGVIRGVIDTVTAAIKGDWEGVWNGIKSIFQSIWNGIKTHVTTIINAVKNVISSVINGIKGTISTVLNTIKNVWSNVWNGLKNTVTRIFNGIKNTVKNSISNVVNTIRNLPNTIKNIFSNAGSWLLNAGKNIIQGFINGIKGAFNRVKDTLSSLTNLLPSWKGPPSKDKKILQGAGNMIIQGLSKGLRDEFSTVKKDLVSLTKDIASTDLGTVSTPRVTMDIDGATRGGAQEVHYHVEVQALAPTPEIGRQVVRAIKDFERLNGREMFA